MFFLLFQAVILRKQSQPIVLIVVLVVLIVVHVVLNAVVVVLNVSTAP
jgi:hypothetical protein